MKGIAVKKGINKAGKGYALVRLANGRYLVYARRVNYKAGRYVTSWGFVTPGRMTATEAQKLAREGMERTPAVDLYRRRIAGKTG